jgi:hypothetical protein
MSHPPNPPEASSPDSVAESSDSQSSAESAEIQPSSTSQPQPSYVRLAMRNMVRKGRKSLFHFALTTLGLLALLVGLAYITR